MGSLARVSPVATLSSARESLIMITVTSLILASAISVSHSLDLGYGGLPGQRTERGGSVWPPFPGANQGYWARRAGFYNTLPNFGSTALQKSSSVVSTTQTIENLEVTSSPPPTSSLASAATTRLLQLQTRVTGAPATAVPVYNPYAFKFYNNRLP